MYLRFSILLFFLINWTSIFAQQNVYEIFNPIRDSLLTAHVEEYKLKGDAIIVLINKNDAINSACLLNQQYKTNEGKKTLITYWHKKNGDLKYLDWFSFDVDEVEYLHLSGDSLFQLQILIKERMNREIVEDYRIIGKLDSFPEVIFSYKNWRWKYQDHELIDLEEGSLLNKKHFISYEDINGDGYLDILDREVLQLYKPKDCSCENGVMPKIIEHRYIYKNAIFVPEDVLETDDD